MPLLSPPLGRQCRLIHFRFVQFLCWLDTLVQIFQMQLDKQRGCVTEEHKEQELFIHSNALPFFKADKFLKKALTRHFRGGKWHFKSDKCFLKSATLIRFDKTKSKFPFIRKVYFQLDIIWHLILSFLLSMCLSLYLQIKIFKELVVSHIGRNFWYSYTCTFSLSF